LGERDTMFVFSNFLGAVARTLNILLSLYMLLIIGRAILSWIHPDPYSPLVRFLVGATEPLLAPLRKILPGWRMGIDLSPILALLIIYFLKIFLVQNLFDLARRF